MNTNVYTFSLFNIIHPTTHAPGVHGPLYYTCTRRTWPTLLHMHQAHRAHLPELEKVKRPTLCAAGEEWSYFLSRWSDYSSATKVTGRDKVIQLLECCNEPLHRDLTKPHWQNSRWSLSRTGSPGRKYNGRHSVITQHEAGSWRNCPQSLCSTSTASWHIKICYNVPWVWWRCKLHCAMSLPVKLQMPRYSLTSSVTSSRTWLSNNVRKIMHNDCIILDNNSKITLHTRFNY